MSPWLAGILGSVGTLLVVLFLVAVYRTGKDDGIKQERQQWTAEMTRQGWVPESGPVPEDNGGASVPGGDGGRG